MLFTNRELAAIATTRPASRNALLQVEGVGPGKIERYGEAILAMVAPERGNPSPAEVDTAARSNGAAEP